jgi:hypothetical protein
MEEETEHPAPRHLKRQRHIRVGDSYQSSRLSFRNSSRSIENLTLPRILRSSPQAHFSTSAWRPFRTVSLIPALEASSAFANKSVGTWTVIFFLSCPGRFDEAFIVLILRGQGSPVNSDDLLVRNARGDSRRVAK